MTLAGCVFFQNEASNGNGGAIQFVTTQGILEIYDTDENDSRFIENLAQSGHGGAIYQYGGYIDIVSGANPPDETFTGNLDSGFVPVPGGDNGHSMYLIELTGAIIDASSDDANFRFYIYTANPPTPTTATINLTRFGGRSPGSNWAGGWFY